MSISTVTSLKDIDLADPDLHLRNDQVEIFRRLRQEAPVHWNESRGAFASFWSLR